MKKIIGFLFVFVALIAGLFTAHIVFTKCAAVHPVTADPCERLAPHPQHKHLHTANGPQFPVEW